MLASDYMASIRHAQALLLFPIGVLIELWQDWLIGYPLNLLPTTRHCEADSPGVAISAEL